MYVQGTVSGPENPAVNKSEKALFLWMLDIVNSEIYISSQELPSRLQT